MWLRALWAFLSCTQGQGTSSLVKTGAMTALVLVGGQWIYVSIDKAGKTLECRVPGEKACDWREEAIATGALLNHRDGVNSGRPIFEPNPTYSPDVNVSLATQAWQNYDVQTGRKQFEETLRVYEIFESWGSGFRKFTGWSNWVSPTTRIYDWFVGQ